MLYGLYQSAAGMMVNEYRQDVVANNLANADTVGFKRDVATFSERQIARLAGLRRGPAAGELDRLSGGVWLGPTYVDFGEGPLKQTGNDLDVALAGPGFFVVRDHSGRVLLTRDGRFVMDRDGRLVAATDGAEVLGVGGQPIRLNPYGGPARIDEDGNVHQRGAIVGRLSITDVRDYGALRKVGAGRFAFDATATAPAAAHVIPGHVESSGVEPVRELVSMLEASRAYQINAQMLRLQDESAGRLINAVAAA